MINDNDDEMIRNETKRNQIIMKQVTNQVVIQKMVKKLVIQDGNEKDNENMIVDNNTTM